LDFLHSHSRTFIFFFLSNHLILINDVPVPSAPNVSPWFSPCSPLQPTGPSFPQTRQLRLTFLPLCPFPRVPPFFPTFPSQLTTTVQPARFFRYYVPVRHQWDMLSTSPLSIRLPYYIVSYISNLIRFVIFLSGARFGPLCVSEFTPPPVPYHCSSDADGFSVFDATGFLNLVLPLTPSQTVPFFSPLVLYSVVLQGLSETPPPPNH